MILDLISGGGDSDTIASIAGQITGTFIGRKALPDEMLSRIVDIGLIEKTAAEFGNCITRISK